MLEISVNLIGGMMVGIEFPPLDEDVSFGMVVDLFLLRFIVTYWKQAT